jgi:hypothetical protein
MMRVLVRPDDKDWRRTIRTLRRIRAPGRRREVVRPGVNKAAVALNKRMKQRARVLPTARFLSEKRGSIEIPGKELSRSIGVRRKTYMRSGWVIAVVGPRYTYRMPNGFQPSAVAVFIEGLRQNDGLQTSPTPFARPAVRATHSLMVAIFRRETKSALDRMVEKIRAQGSRI